MRNAYVVVSAMLLAGCASHSPLANDEPARAGQVGMRVITGQIARPSRVALAPNESFLVPIEDDANAMPAYPEALLSKSLPPQAVCVSVAVDRDGTVISSAPVAAPPDCPTTDEVDPAFFAAVQRSVAP